MEEVRKALDKYKQKFTELLSRHNEFIMLIKTTLNSKKKKLAWKNARKLFEAKILLQRLFKRQENTEPKCKTTRRI